MSKTAFVFPGQGSQYVGMGKDLYEKYPEVREVFDQADSILGIPLSRICFDGPEDELRITVNTQPALFTTSVACFKLLEKNGICPDIVAGHSIGEYAALVAAGAIKFEDALPLVRRRGELMSKAGADRPGAMSAIIGMDADAVRAACDAAKIIGIVEVANYNSSNQIVISGEVEAVNAASQYAKEAGARKVVPLPVSGAFHSSLMLPASEALAKELAKTCFTDARIPVIANISADYVCKADDIRNALARQIAGSVRWEETMTRMAQDGVSHVVEVGPGKVLSGLIKRAIENVEVYNAGDAASVEAVITALTA
ncbi:MAG: ACP S-malonyltransferase [Armatimonadota bacterium]